jgi:HEAT repeat protein
MLNVITYALFFSAAIVARGGTGDEPTKADIPVDVSRDLRTLIEATFSGEQSEQAEALRTLRAMGERAGPAVPFLARLWVCDDPTLSFDAFSVLRQLGDPAADACIAAVRRSSGKKRHKLLLELGQFRNPRAVDGIVGFLRDADAGTRRTAAHSLNTCIDPRVVLPLIQAFGDPNPEVRQMAISHFNSNPDPLAMGPIIDALKDTEVAVRMEAGDVLCWQKDLRIVPALTDVLQDAREAPDVRKSAAFSLSQSQDPRAAGPLLAIFNDSFGPEAARREAAYGLAAFKYRPAVESLIAVVKEIREPVKVRAAAAYALTQLGDRRANEVLTKLAKADVDEELRFWSAMGVLEFNNGAVDDVGLVTPIGEFAVYVDGREEHADAKWKAMKKVVENGKTDAVRAEARKIIGRKWRKWWLSIEH